MRRGLATIAVLAAVPLAIWIRAGDDEYTLRAQFDDAAGLRRDFAVKIGGVPVGRVASVGLGEEDRAVAVLRIDRGAAPVGRDVKATIRPSNLLGEKYVELEPGDARRPAASGTVIPRSRTATPTELDDLLNVLDAPTRSALGIFISEQGKALTGRGDELAGTLVALPPALDQARELVAGLGRDNHALGRLVESSDRILVSVARERRSLGRFVGSAGGALDALASRRRQLGDTVRRAPSTMAQVRRSLIELERMSAPLQPAARGLRATAGPLTATLRELPAFARAATPTLRTARTVAPQLDVLGRRATPVVRRLRPLASDLRQFGRALAPFSALLDDVMPDLLGVMEGWGRSIQNRDAAGHVFRVGATFASDVVHTLREEQILDPPPEKQRRRSRPDPSRAGAQPLPEAKAPSLGSGPTPRVPLPKVPVPRLPGPHVPQVPVPGAPPTGDGSTSDVLDYLLGP